LRFGIVVFPGTNCDRDTHDVLTRVMGQEASFVWHGDGALADCECLVLPGGFAHGDYLRAGAIARFSPVMDAVAAFAEAGKPVLGICNGFQVLVEAGLLPGAMMRNAGLRFVCKWVNIRVESLRSVCTQACREGEVLRIPIAHGEGNYYCDPATLGEMTRARQVLFRYCEADGSITPASNPNGSVENIAGIANRAGNVVGLMPHPERACEHLLGSDDGRRIFESVIRSLIVDR
jgi:phosphoribosylformylglycinamidine synthase